MQGPANGLDRETRWGRHWTSTKSAGFRWGCQGLRTNAASRRAGTLTAPVARYTGMICKTVVNLTPKPYCYKFASGESAPALFEALTRAQDRSTRARRTVMYCRGFPFPALGLRHLTITCVAIAALFTLSLAPVVEAAASPFEPKCQLRLNFSGEPDQWGVRWGWNWRGGAANQAPEQQHGTGSRQSAVRVHWIQRVRGRQVRQVWQGVGRFTDFQCRQSVQWAIRSRRIDVGNARGRIGNRCVGYIYDALEYQAERQDAHDTIPKRREAFDVYWYCL